MTSLLISVVFVPIQIYVHLSLFFPSISLLSLYTLILNGTSFRTHAQAKLLARNAEDAAGSANSNGAGEGAPDKALRKMLADVFVDNARLRMQVNSVIRCALNTDVTAEKDEDESLHEKLF